MAIPLATIVALVVYGAQWHEAAKANVINGRSFRQAQRAWVGPDIMTSEVSLVTDPLGQKRISWRIAVKNFGLSPAMNVRFHSEDMVIREASPMDMQRVFDRLHMLKPDYAGYTMFPGGTIPNSGLTVPITQSDIDDLVAYRKQVAVGGVVSYQDVFGATHMSQFC